MTDIIEKSLSIALEAHKGQRDKAGESYILHPLRIAHNFSDPEYIATALLHDVIEDSDYTEQKLLGEGIPSQVVEAVKALTKPKGVDYMQYLQGVKANEIARQVKLKDIEDNLNVLRLESLDVEDLERVERYHKAHRYLSKQGELIG